MRFENRIISASAGTGKTYRLSVEYICLLLKYYVTHPDFRTDSILVITFTRKACAEIRERIISQMDKLISGEDEGLLKSIRGHIPGDPKSLSIDEENKLRSARYEIKADNRNLQVMTIDSYIGGIFRNIVRPLKSIDSYDLEINAEMKRMPALMQHLLQPKLIGLLERILSRKVERSMDAYASLFKGLIQNRWIYYLIRNCSDHHPSAQDPLQYDFALDLKELIGFIAENKKKPQKKLLLCFKKDFSKLFSHDDLEAGEIIEEIIKMSRRSSDAMKILHVLQKQPIFNKPDLNKDMHSLATDLQDRTLRALGEKLYYEFFLAEQEEILQLWESVLAEYDRLLYYHKTLNYDDISWLTFEALFSPDPPLFRMEDASEATEFYAFLSHRSRFMLIDEFQDTSLLQFKILLPIMEEISSGYGSKDFGGIVVVGDEKQSIFGWRGGERDLLIKLKDIIPSLGEVKMEKLSHSYRVGEDMMSFINSIFSDTRLHEYLADQDMAWDYPLVKSALGNVSGSIEYKTMGFNSIGGEKPMIYQSFVDDMLLPAISKSKDETVAIICRTNKQLAQLQLLLEDEDKSKSPVFQPNAPIIEHHLVAPLISWMRYLAYKDYLDLLALLRSDYLRISSGVLKEIVDTIHAHESRKPASDQELTFEDIEVAHKLYLLAQKLVDSPPSVILQETVDLLFAQPENVPERDYLNLHAFIRIAQDWELNHAKDGLLVSEFLDYLIQNQEQEDFTQVSVENREGIELLSIHRSKGLQFDRVFVFYELSSASRKKTELYQALDFGDSGFRKISQYALSYHFEQILPHSPMADLYSQRQRAALLEELNNLYVALTRAKKHLHIFLVYPSKKEWGDYYEYLQGNGSVKLTHVMAEILHSYFADIPKTETGVHSIKRDYPEKKTDEDAKESPKSATQLRVARHQPPDLAKMPDYPLPDAASFKELYLDKRQALWGDIAHFYLSFIKRDLPDEHSLASRQAISRYGSLVPKAKLEKLFASVREALREHSYLFSGDYDRIFCELEVGTHRIDRLMIDMRAKLGVIVDYKTGGIHEEDQLEIYQKELMKLPILQGFSWDLRYVMLSI